MLVVRKDQLAALNAPRLERFARELRDALSRRFPARFPTADGAPVIEFVERAIAAAFQHGINREGSVARFAHLRASYGESFEWTPAEGQALALLHDRSLPDPIKIAAMVDCLDGETGGRAITVVAGNGEA